MKPTAAPVMGVHLVRRFFTSLSPAAPPEADEQWAESWLTPAEVGLWRRLPNHDRRHCVQVGRNFVARRPGATRAEVAGALLHDIGKVDVGLSIPGRVVARLIGPRTRRLRLYLDHERIGSELLVASGSDPVTVDLVDGRGPAWPDLEAADNST
ncbi:MAG: hypothetical protein ACRDZZ_06165 [Ilumatobacteraceae bacterium]